MQAIARDVYIEDHFPGVTLGAISLPQGLILVDAPPSPEDVRAWRATLLTLSNASERMLINLDAHPDRTLGARAMDCVVLAHELTAAVFRTRPGTFKAQGEETGADWESIPGLGNVRWVMPELTFDQEMILHLGDKPVIVEYHPGPSAGSSWVLLPDEKIVFIGDAVMRGQPPFLGSADIPAWQESLKLLASPAYHGWHVISGRGGLVNVDHIRAQGSFLKMASTKIEKLASKKVLITAIDDLARSLLGEFKVASSRQHKYFNRLRYGIYHYFTRNYQPSSRAGTEE
jgi:glyoxylase-like metal-dependent hydrolase (beta-lactamase superfamily II)